MKLYYSTYGMQQLDIFEALPRLNDLGYEGIEISVTPGWPTDPVYFDKGKQKQLYRLLQELSFPTPPLMALLSPCITDQKRGSELAQFQATFEMAQQLRVDENPSVVTTTLGHSKPDWNSGKGKIKDLLLEVADLAAKRDVTVAIEPHAGDDFETPEKAAWLMEQTNHPHLKLNFDYSHFLVEDMELSHCLELNLPYAAHNHIKDGYKDESGRVRYLLPGEGKLDLSNYIRSLQEAGWDRYVCPEVTAQIWKLSDYDPWKTAKFCYSALDSARTS